MEERLTNGDKLPSERELSERLGVARSSVREALRALELLDLIETRRGEGTFFNATGSHRLVDIILMYMLKDDTAKKDLKETRRIIELDAIRLGLKNISSNLIKKLEEIYSTQINASFDKQFELDYEFHKTLVEASNNKLLINIWVSLVDFHKATIDTQKLVADPKKKLEDHRKILYLLKEQNKKEALLLIEQHLESNHF